MQLQKTEVFYSVKVCGIHSENYSRKKINFFSIKKGLYLEGKGEER